MPTPRSFRALTPRTLALGAGLAALTLAAATPAAAQYRDQYRPPVQAYASYGSYGQSYGRADTRVVVTYGQPSPYDYGYSYPRTGAAGAVYEGETRVYAATGAAATGRGSYGYDDYGYGGGYYQSPRPHDGYAYRYRQRHDSYGRGHDRDYDRGGRYGYSRYQGYRDEYGYQDDRPRSDHRRDRYDDRYDRRDRRYDRRRDCDCSDVYMYDR
jgi:hypothetical protein